jgi:Mycotoxin biosynthesis protein UstYa
MLLSHLFSDKLTDHCIETLRQWLMCLPDLTPRSVIWREDGLSAKANNTIVHTCVDWDAVQSWIDRHIISGAQPLLKSPNGTVLRFSLYVIRGDLC